MAFGYYNPNPNYKKGVKDWKHNDCVVRALCAATGHSWKTCFTLITKIAESKCLMPNDYEVVSFTLESLGFTKVKNCSTKLQVKDFAKKSKKDHKTYICRFSRHIVCCREGIILDTWDCSEQEVKQYWVK